MKLAKRIYSMRYLRHQRWLSFMLPHRERWEPTGLTVDMIRRARAILKLNEVKT